VANLLQNIVIVPIADKDATWDVFVAWQRGKAAAPVRALIDALGFKVSAQGGRQVTKEAIAAGH
jgi:hypothetical protein